ncbi:MAG: hypothetical protein WCE54_23665 [Ignavibacteriaceae bacterium]
MKKHKWLIFSSAIVLITFSLLYFLHKDESTISQKMEFKKGIETIDYKKGKDSLVINHRQKHKKGSIKKNKNEKIFIRADSTENYDITFNILPTQNPDTIDFEYFLNIKSKELTRIDTLFKFRTDTLTIEKTEIKFQKNPFYNTFWFGAAVTSFIILLISLLTK